MDYVNKINEHLSGKKLLNVIYNNFGEIEFNFENDISIVVYPHGEEGSNIKVCKKEIVFTELFIWD